ncbi:cysteine-rich KTR domain-containing protein [Lachnospiraceae bacterium 45-W7]
MQQHWGNTVLINYPLYFRSVAESLIKAKNLQITIITEPDAKIRSQ